MLQVLYGATTHLYGVVSEATDDLVVVVLEAVDSLAVLTVTLDPSESVSRILPVALHVLWRERER